MSGGALKHRNKNLGRAIIVGLIAVLAALEVAQEFVGAGELAVEAHFIAKDVGRMYRMGNGLAADLDFPETFLFLGRHPFIVFVFSFVVVVDLAGDAEEAIAEVEFIVDMVKLAGDNGGFGADGAAGAPEGVRDFVDEIQLETGLRLEFTEEGAQEKFEFLFVLFEVL